MSDRLFTPTEKFNTMSVEPVTGGPLGTGKGLDANRYATKKTIAQGMLDIALLTANASQLKYVLTVGDKHEFYTLMLVLISISLVLQAVTGVLLIILAATKIDYRAQNKVAEYMNHIIMGLNMLILAQDSVKMGFNNGFVQWKNGTVLVP